MEAACAFSGGIAIGSEALFVSQERGQDSFEVCLMGSIERCRLVAVECLAEFAEERQTMQSGVEDDAISGIARRRNQVDLLVCVRS